MTMSKNLFCPTETKKLKDLLTRSYGVNGKKTMFYSDTKNLCSMTKDGYRIINTMPKESPLAHLVLKQQRYTDIHAGDGTTTSALAYLMAIENVITNTTEDYSHFLKNDEDIDKAIFAEISNTQCTDCPALPTSRENVLKLINTTLGCEENILSDDQKEKLVSYFFSKEMGISLGSTIHNHNLPAVVFDNREKFSVKCKFLCSKNETLYNAIIGIHDSTISDVDVSFYASNLNFMKDSEILPSHAKLVVICRNATDKAVKRAEAEKNIELFCLEGLNAEVCDVYFSLLRQIFNVADLESGINAQATMIEINRLFNSDDKNKSEYKKLLKDENIEYTEDLQEIKNIVFSRFSKGKDYYKQISEVILDDIGGFIYFTVGKEDTQKILATINYKITSDTSLNEQTRGIYEDMKEVFSNSAIEIKVNSFHCPDYNGVSLYDSMRDVVQMLRVLKKSSSPVKMMKGGLIGLDHVARSLDRHSSVSGNIVNQLRRILDVDRDNDAVDSVLAIFSSMRAIFHGVKDALTINNQYIEAK